MTGEEVGSNPKARILVVEDDPSARLALQAILEALEYEVIMSNNGMMRSLFTRLKVLRST